MSESPGGGAPPQFSPDGQWWWSGTEWVPAAHAPAIQSNEPVQPVAPPTPPPASTPSSNTPRKPGFWAGWPTWLTVVLAIAFLPITGFIVIWRRTWSSQVKWGATAAWAVFCLIATIASAGTTSPSTNGSQTANAAHVQSPAATEPTATTPSPSPVAKPSPAPTRSAPPPPPPAPAAPAQPAAIHLSGSGQGTPHFTVTQGLAIIAASCSCSGNFAVELLDSSGNSKDIPINTIGSYSGSVGEGLDAGSYILNVTADGPWNITITQPRGVDGATLPHTYSKHGQWIVGPFAAESGAVSIQAQNSGSGNFAVEVLDQDGQSQDIPINEIGNYNGSVISNDLSNGPFYMNVTSDGNWTITVSNP